MSPFAEALKSLLDDSGVFDRKDWAYLCGVKQIKIDDWLADTSIPRPHDLNMIVITIERSSDMKKEPLEKFIEVTQRRATEVSPHGARMLPTVCEYMKRPAFNELSSQLAKLEPQEQAKLLLRIYP